ncbi:presqualene diphosphate synthase HpnD [Methylocapsa palsarum]|uniref:Phytoene synthase n=1 Tax=Methylocapsa palsarum TaxID=1612308 RepID=A0A1I3VTL3_9HYPH|nr:presqualene diphosphate synthase HpnD [Methylocapsa palsarum]SFJ97617.1 phytoene synthase [Methylocapsa palsarum]
MSEGALNIDEQNAAAASRGSSFYAPMRILPRPRREAMFEIYSFCRAVDDIADEGGSREARTRALDQWRASLDALYARSAPPGLRGLAEAIRLFDLQKEDFLAVIDGMQMDVDADIRAPDAATLDLYCDRVASAVGRLSVRVFGIPPEERQGLAHHLGRAFQLTNILRDIDEDAAIGRLYLPREALQAAGISPDAPPAALAAVALDRACAPLVASARTHFDEARKIMSRCARESLRAPKIMAEVYESILERLIRRGFAPPRERVRTPRHRVILAVLRHGLF